MPFPLPILMCTSIQEAISANKLTEYYFIPAGQICGAVKEVKKARKVVEDMVNGAIQILEEGLPSRVKLSN